MLELFKELQLDRNVSSPLYLQLYQVIREMIESGRLLRDTKLPSIRSLSQLLGINQVTVVTAYRQLEAAGFLYKKPGSGTFVAGILHRFSATSGNPALQDELYPQVDTVFLPYDQVSITECTTNFASAIPTPDLFPVDNFKLVLNEVLDRDRGNAFNYHKSQGFLSLRSSITGLLAKNGMDFSVEDINVISGAQQGIDIIAKALVQHGDCIITESPTYTGAVAVFKSRNAQLVDVAMRAGGPDLNTLEYMIKKYKPAFMYTIPSFQNPTGCSYTNEKRKALLGLAEKYNFIIMEDDYVSDLDFEQKNYPTLKALDTNERVILIKSFSKLFLPGLRLGYMVVPPKLTQDLLTAKHTTDISTSSLVQRSFDLYIRKGYWNSHLEFMYKIYEARYQKIITALDTFLPKSCSFLKPGGGLNIWVSLPAGFPVNSLFHLAAANDIAFAPGIIFHTGNTPDATNNLRLSFAAVPIDKIEAGIEKLCSLINRLSNFTHSSSSISVF